MSDRGLPLSGACRPAGRRSGFSFIELMVVIAIMGILVTLLIPAIQSAREAARRSNCSRNLSQLMVAVQQYDASFQRYPAGTLNPKGPILSQPLGYHHSWISHLLPYLEQKNAYRRIDRTVGVYHANNRPARRTEIQALRCPSTPARGLGYSDYAGVHHDREAPIDVDNNGIFFLNSAVRYRDVLDGTSQTCFLGEKHTLIGDLGWMSGTRSTLRNMVSQQIVGATTLVPFAQTRPADLGDADAQPPLAGPQLLDSLFGRPIDRNLLGVRDRTPAFVRPKNPLLAVGGFESAHFGGLNFARGDGSVFFVSGGIDSRTYMYMGNRADRLLLDDDMFR